MKNSKELHKNEILCNFSAKLIGFILKKSDICKKLFVI